MLDILLNKYDIEYDELIETDKKILKKLYFVDASNKDFKVKIEDDSVKNMKNIFSKSTHLCSIILNRSNIDMMLPDVFDENNLTDYLVLENLLLLEKTKQNKLVNFSEFMNNSGLGYDENYIYKKLKAILYYSPFEELYEVYKEPLTTDKRSKYITKLFLVPIFSNIIHHCENEPYLNFYIKRKHDSIKKRSEDLEETFYNLYNESFDTQYNRIKKFFDANLFSLNADHKKDSLNFYSVSDNSTEFEKEEVWYLELMCYYVLDGLYNLSNLTFVSKYISENEFQIDKHFIIDLLYKTVLIPDILNKNLYTKNILDDFKVADIFDKENSIEKLGALEEKYRFYTKQINFISYVYLPLLSKCFNVVCYQSYKDFSKKSFEKDLKKYVIKNELLSKYELKTNNALLDLSELDEKEKATLFDLFINIERSIFNTQVLKLFKNKMSIDYLNSDFPYANIVLNTIFQEKINDCRTATELYFHNLAHHIDL